MVQVTSIFLHDNFMKVLYPENSTEIRGKYAVGNQGNSIMKEMLKSRYEIFRVVKI
jgi:hypothetical protein